MIDKLRTKKTLAVVSVLVEVMVGIAIKLHSYSEWKREKIALVERTLSRDGISYNYIRAEISQDAVDQISIKGDAIITTTWNSGIGPEPKYRTATIRFVDGEWRLAMINDWAVDDSSSWELIKEYAIYFLP